MSKEDFVREYDRQYSLRLQDAEVARPIARRSDPHTSRSAAESVRIETITKAQIGILTLLCEYGDLTDEEIAQKWHAERRGPISPSGLRTRRVELHQQYLVTTAFDSSYKPLTRPTASGRAARVWKITDEGVAYLESLAS